MTGHKKDCSYQDVFPDKTCPCNAVKLNKTISTIEWEEIPNNMSGYMFRAKVPNGWLVKEVQDVLINQHGITNASGYQWTSSITFVPDFEHLWVI